MVIVGEAWGNEERRKCRPFVGYTGRLLRKVLAQVDIPLEDVYLTNVFNLQPQPTNDVTNLCGPKTLGIPNRSALQSGKYVRQEYEGELDRLEEELNVAQSNLVVACGNTALWALTGNTGITSARGTVCLGYKDRKVLACFHPSAVMRQPSLLPTLFADLSKAKREMESPEYRRPSRLIHIPECITDIVEYIPKLMKADVLSIDIETIRTVISCIGFAPSSKEALVIPFFDKTKESGAYWEREMDELAAWKLVKFICNNHKHVVGQNFNFDMHHLFRTYGITVPGARSDTMLAHHALQPELKKGLAFLASFYTDEASWKFMRKGVGLKKED